MTRVQIEDRLLRLADAREGKLLSDGRAFTNGTVKRIDDEAYQLRLQLARMGE